MSRAIASPAHILVRFFRIGVLSALEPESIPVEVSLIDRELVRWLLLDVRLVGERVKLCWLSCPLELGVQFNDEPGFGFRELHQHRSVDPADIVKSRELLPTLLVEVRITDLPVASAFAQ